MGKNKTSLGKNSWIVTDSTSSYEQSFSFCFIFINNLNYLNLNEPNVIQKLQAEKVS